MTLKHARTFAVGVEVGRAHDPTAICVASRIVTTPTNPAVKHLNPFPHPRYEVAHLERLRLGIPYPQQVDYLERIMGRQPLSAPRAGLLVDYTGVGRPVFDMFGQRAALRHAQGVVITGGRETSRTRGSVVGAQGRTGEQVAGPATRRRPANRRRPAGCRRAGPETPGLSRSVLGQRQRDI